MALDFDEGKRMLLLCYEVPLELDNNVLLVLLRCCGERRAAIVDSSMSHPKT